MSWGSVGDFITTEENPYGIGVMIIIVMLVIVPNGTAQLFLKEFLMKCLAIFFRQEITNQKYEAHTVKYV